MARVPMILVPVYLTGLEMVLPVAGSRMLMEDALSLRLYLEWGSEVGGCMMGSKLVGLEGDVSLGRACCSLGGTELSPGDGGGKSLARLGALPMSADPGTGEGLDLEGVLGEMKVLSSLSSLECES